MSPKRGADDPRLGAPSPADEHATTPNRPAPPRPPIADGAAASRPRARLTPGRTRTGGTWVGLVLGAVVLIFLLVFVLQNLVPVRVSFLGLHGTLPLGIWLLFAAIAGVLLVAIPALGRLLPRRRGAGRR